MSGIRVFGQRSPDRLNKTWRNSIEENLGVLCVNEEAVHDRELEMSPNISTHNEN